MRSRTPVSRIGIFGGTFDPPHVGHLTIALEALRQLSLEKVLFIPAYVPPHKKRGGRANPLQRLRMVKRAIAGNPKFEVTELEIRRKGISYTIDTLRELRLQYRDAKFFLIVGGDNFASFKTWKSVNAILKMASIVVYERNAIDKRSRMTRLRKVIHLRGALLGISSTMIREHVKRGESIRFLVSESVRRFIGKNKLYL